MKSFSARVALACLMTGQPVVGVVAQTTFELDTTFRAPFQARNIIDALILPDGDLVLSGAIRVEGDEEGLLRTGVRVNPDGTRDLNFPTAAYMGAHLTPWQDKLYANGYWRLNMPDFSLDPTWDLLNAPMISLFQYGQYHVFPDGRVLMSGLHDLSDTEHGFVGSYELIWLTNTGQLDTTRIHRNANGYLRTIEMTPDGKFMCWGSGTQFEGHAVPRVFRTNADGSWDSSFVAPFVPFSGFCFDFLPIEDGRCYAVGRFFLPNITDTLHLIRFMPDGSLDPTFNNTASFGLSPTQSYTGALLSGITKVSDDRFLVYGTFDHVEGQSHRGICVIDSMGNVLHEYFQGNGCGPYNYLGSTYSSIDGVALTGDGDLYVWGAYQGYDDGTVNDTLQRLISRLHIPDLGVALPPPPVPGLSAPFHVAPNPAQDHVNIHVHSVLSNPLLTLRDALGKVVHQQRMYGPTVNLQLGELSNGVYLVEVIGPSGRIGSQRLVVQH